MDLSKQLQETKQTSGQDHFRLEQENKKLKKQLEDNANEATDGKQLDGLSKKIRDLQTSLGKKTLEIDELKKANEVLKQDLAERDADLKSTIEMKDIA